MSVTLQNIIESLDLKVLAGATNFSQIVPLSGYASDLLSCVMAGAKAGGVWVTIQSHGNVVAVATLLEQCAVIIAENSLPEADVIAKANEQGVPLLLSSQPIFEVVGRLYAMGLRGE